MTKHINTKNYFNRTGIILYYKKDNVINFIFGVDKKYGELTDFGGTNDDPLEDFIHSSIRELNEESMGIFNLTEKYELFKNSSVAVYDDSMIILFQEISLDNEIELIHNYKKIYNDGVLRGLPPSELENSFVIWIEHNKFKDLLYDKDINKNKISPVYNQSSVILPTPISNLISNDYRRSIKTYPHLYNRVRILIKPIYNKLINKLSGL